jgi:hypothetical protein
MLPRYPKELWRIAVQGSIMKYCKKMLRLSAKISKAVELQIAYSNGFAFNLVMRAGTVL